MSMRKTTLVAASAALALLAAACGGGDEGSDEGQASGGDVRSIEVEALDSLRFEPASIEVQAGETVRFVVTNTGSAIHDFYVGTDDEQADHEAEMAEGGMGMDHDADPEADALTLKAGETDEIMLTFDEAGILQFACHQPGHYAGGMIGIITVT